MNTIWIMALEPIETRYTCQWFNGLPKLLEKEAKKRNIDVNIINLYGTRVSKETSAGAFLNFSETNVWKNDQLNWLANEFNDGAVEPGDKILFTDAWHTGVIQTKYMSELLDIPVEIHAMWHAGSYDPQDFLGRKIKDKRWSRSFEISLLNACDYNYFATNFHINLIKTNLIIFDKYDNSGLAVNKLPHYYNGNQDIAAVNNYIEIEKFVRSGQPHNELIKELEKYKDMDKRRNLILFPHRLAPEKQPEIFRDLAKSMPEYEWVVCQDTPLTKHEYHTLLGESKLVFSANLQETLGIGAMEAILVNSIPMVPDRLSYSEMYEEQFKYPSEYTYNWDCYLKHKDSIMKYIKNYIDHYDNYEVYLNKQRERLIKNYLYPGKMLDKLLGEMNG